MKNKPHPNLGIRSSLALALALAIWAPVQAQSVEPVEEKTTMAERSQAIKEQKLNQKGVAMKGYVQDIESLAVKNNDFRRVLYTAENWFLKDFNG